MLLLHMGIYFQHSITTFYFGDAHNEKLVFFLYQGSVKCFCWEITFSFIFFQVQHVKCGEFLRDQ